MTHGTRTFSIALGLSLMLLVGSCSLVDLTATSIAPMWLAGAVALGLLSGYTTGASAETSAGSELMKFLAGAIVAPLLGSVVSLTSPTGTAPTPTIHPMWALGAFFLGFSSAALLGIAIGIYLREKQNFMINQKR